MSRLISETPLLDNIWSTLVILLFRDPHCSTAASAAVEGGDRAENGASNPGGILLRRNHFDAHPPAAAHARWSKGSHFLLHSISKSWEQGGATSEDNVVVEDLSDLKIAPIDGRVDKAFMDTTKSLWTPCVLIPEVKKESLGASEFLFPNVDDCPVGKLIGCVRLFLIPAVKGNIAELFLEFRHHLLLSVTDEMRTPLVEDCCQEVCEVLTSHVKAEAGVGKSVALIDGDGVGDTVARVEDNSCGTARSKQGEHSLVGNIDVRGLEFLKHDLSHLLPVGLGGEGSLGEEDRVFPWIETQLAVKGLVPDILHCVPVRHNSVLYGSSFSHHRRKHLPCVKENIITAWVNHCQQYDASNTPWWTIIEIGQASLDCVGAIVQN